eukprot:CAMPEP_0171938620 /NCGR_PEP_ID=MMETSP0993-20121228/35637_1 /TAXON_ID=483369 /ORGANISM="non described non described, Strain CCMP2098" /LENGTH=176 /DNA_ID=CAMNT_0012580257 /DNA_START=75 /DNA_END=605 /DNA_ORIENTATION=+
MAVLESGSYVKGLQLNKNYPKQATISIERSKEIPALTTRYSVPLTTAFLYRIASGDYNAIHVDPSVAESMGLPGGRPILHGLCTLGMATRALMAATAPLGCGGDAQLLRSLRCRFVSSAYPGEDLETQLWPSTEKTAVQTGTTATLFRVVAQPRGAIVVDFGIAVIGKAKQGRCRL